MKTKNKKILFLILFSAILFSPFMSKAAENPPSTLTPILNRIENAVVEIGAGLAIIGFIIAGILWLMSAGNPEKTGTAKKAVIAAVIGTALVAMATGTKVIIKIINNIIG